LSDALGGLGDLAIWMVPIVLAVTLHEAAHGYAALLLGDRTAQERGRISLNPIRHIDPVGTLLLPAAELLMHAPLFGWAKPVPVDFRNLRHPRRDMMLVALAGPATNIVLAVASTALFRLAAILPESARDPARQVLYASIYLNVFLAILNMLPVPPLDGGRVAVGLLPDALAFRFARVERFGIILVLGLFILVPMATRAIGYEISPGQFLVLGPADWLVERLAGLFGLS
jgi:Zn-dependent protease